MLNFLKYDNFTSLLHLLTINDELDLRYKNETIILNYNFKNTNHILSTNYYNNKIVIYYSKKIDNKYMDIHLNIWTIHKIQSGFYIKHKKQTIYFIYENNTILEIYTKNRSCTLEFHNNIFRKITPYMRVEYSLIILYPIINNKINFNDNLIFKLLYQNNKLIKLFKNTNVMLDFIYSDDWLIDIIFNSTQNNNNNLFKLINKNL
jgi:hypothetical protein